MRKLRAALVAAALAAVALITPATASAAPLHQAAPVHQIDHTRAATLAFGWND